VLANVTVERNCLEIATWVLIFEDTALRIPDFHAAYNQSTAFCNNSNNDDDDDDSFFSVISLSFVEAEDALPCSQEPTIVPHSEPNDCSLRPPS
jgi:hypothetical protein